MQTEIAREYAVALFSIGLEEKTCHELYEELKRLQTVLSDCKEATAYLDSPSIPRSQRSKLIEDVFEEQFSKTISSFLHILSDRRQMEQLDAILNSFEEIYFEEFRISRALVTSPIELSEEQKERLQAKLEKKSGRKIIMEYAVDPSLLGGITVDLDGNRMDGSVKNRLATLKGMLEQ